MRTASSQGRSDPARRSAPPVEIRPDDVIVSPEFLFGTVLETFPGRSIVVLSNSFSFERAFMRAVRRGHDPNARVAYCIGIWEACLKSFEMVEMGPSAYVPVSFSPSRFPFRREKEPLITYMPRKRPDEALIIDRALRRRGRLAGYDLQAIDGVPLSQLRDLLGRTRIFISLLQNEALGFPAAEAMASGCLVIGYTGLGTREYFDEETGVPVAEGDTPGIVEAVEAAAADYERDSRRLDAMRERASGRVQEQYSQVRFRESVLQAFTELDKERVPP